MNFHCSKMSCTKLGMFSSKIFKFTSKTFAYSRNYCHLCLPHACTFKSESPKAQFCTFANNIMSNLAFKILSINYLRYSNAALELPPPKPESTNETLSPDLFGDLGGRKFDRVELDEEELAEEEKQKNIGAQVPRKFKPRLGDYAKMIKHLVLKGDLANAEEVLNLCIRNRDQPNPYLYSLLINAYALQGDVQKCYKYYSDMRSRQFKIKRNIYTSLFNACANSPNSEKALNYLDKVKSHMKKSETPLNHAHYNVLVKAYGRHNQFKKAEDLIQYMIDKRLKIGISTLNSLMYAANTDTANGLCHIYSIWQFMRHQRIPPDIFTYHLLLRAIRDIRFGNVSFENLLNINRDTPATLNFKKLPDLLANPPVAGYLPPLDEAKASPSATTSVPVDPVFASIIFSPKIEPAANTNVTDLTVQNNSLNALPASIANTNLDAVLAQNKLILFGGIDGLLKKMSDDNVKPCTKTFSYLIELVPGSTAAEDILLRHAKAHHVKLDITFYNILIKKRCSRGAKTEAKEVINYIHKADLKPNIMTYGVLALSCVTPAECLELIATMRATGCVLNKYIVQPFITVGMTRLDFKFILSMMELIKRKRIHLDETTFKLLDKFQQDMTAMIKKKDKKCDKETFKAGFSKFNMRYKSWQEELGRKVLVERE